MLVVPNIVKVSFGTEEPKYDDFWFWLQDHPSEKLYSDHTGITVYLKQEVFEEFKRKFDL